MARVLKEGPVCILCHQAEPKILHNHASLYFLIIYSSSLPQKKKIKFPEIKFLFKLTTSQEKFQRMRFRLIFSPRTCETIEN
jgi:hypothetical protein